MHLLGFLGEGFQVFFLKTSLSCICGYGEAKERYVDDGDCHLYFPRRIMFAKRSRRKYQLKIRDACGDFTYDMSLQPKTGYVSNSQHLA